MLIPDVETGEPVDDGRPLPQRGGEGGDGEGARDGS